MQLFTREKTGRVATRFLFLDGDLLELMLSGSVLSDQGRAYDAVKTQIVHDELLELDQTAQECTYGLGVCYQRGVFLVENVTEETLEAAVVRLVNATLLFYGLCIGADRALRNTSPGPDVQ